jgi:NADPH:quinone reductase-like Zn-dependent oxidoreductase
MCQVEAAAQNPTDWKHVAYKLCGPGNVVGCDVAGTVVDGKDQSLIGKRVLIFTKQLLTEGRGLRSRWIRKGCWRV